MSKSVKVGYLMTEIGSVFKNLPFIGMLQMPFTSNEISSYYFKLRTPLRLILIKLVLLVINISIPFVMQASLEKLAEWTELRWLVLTILMMGLLRILLDSLFGRFMMELQQNIKKNVSQEILRNELLNNTRVDYSELWHHVSADLDSLANYHNSFLSVGYEVCRMLFAVCYLYYKMRSAVFVGLAVGVLLITINKKIAARIGRLYDELASIKKRKVKMINFLTSRIQQLKMCRLESYMYEKLRNLRQEELQNLTYHKLLDALCVFNWQMTAVMLAAFTLTVFRIYVDSGSSKTEIMLVINIFQMMLMPLNMLPWALNGITRAKEARDTLSKQLDTKEIILTKVVRDEKSKNVSVCIKPGSINCYGGSVSLKVQAMKLKKGKIYSVSGVHGSGKSTFLKSLAGLVSSNFACEIEGRVGYVDPTSFHLENSLCSVFNNLEIRETDVNNAELKRLMIGFHCLEIPLKNESSTFSGGEKLRLGLVRACLGRDVIIVDGNMNSLDSKVRGYVLHEMQLLAEREGKIFIVKEQKPLSDEIVLIKNGSVTLVKAVAPVQDSLTHHEKDKHNYCDQYLLPLNEMFPMSQPDVKLGATNVSASLFKYYYRSYLHLMFIIALATLYFLKNEFNMYVVNSFDEETFLWGLWRLVPQFIAAALARSFLFALANIFEARRVVNRVIRNICFEKVDIYREKGAEAIDLTFIDSCETVGNAFPFHANILFNNIADFVVIMIMILIRMPPIVLLPSCLLLVIFYNMQSYYRQKIHHLEDMSKFCQIRTLEAVNAVNKGKLLIRSLRDEERYIFQFNKWMERYINVKSCVNVLDRWMTQRFQIISLFLLVSILIGVNFNYESLGKDVKTIGLIITYCVELADKLGYLVKSIADTEKEARCLRKMKEYGKEKKELDMQRVMSVAAKRLVTDKPQSPEQRALTVQHLTFRYGNTAEDILKDLNLRIQPGEKVMIRGKTGSGKTTLFKILTGLYGSKLFSSEGFVSFSPQKPLLLPATLAQNLDPYRLFDAATIEKYSKTFSTKDVSKLSYSEKLRVNMYRAQLYGRNGVIVYDEPGTEICQTATCLIVSHHGDYDVDRRYELKGGKLLDLHN